MNETAQQQPRQAVALRTGGQVAAVVPQSIKEIWEVARGVVASGLAPKSLGSGEDKVSAVAITIMAGMELGLKPMVALRSFTVINGKPALYGDGLITVVRMSGKVKRVKTGCDIRDGKMIGWCEAERSDTGEESRVEFSQDDAIRAGLWSPEDKVRGKVWRDNRQVWVDDAPNESPWHRYPQRMLQWRAAGYCLRELFGDVLGGIRDEFEEREAGEVWQAAYEEAPQQRSQPPAPPPEDEDATDVQEFDAATFGAKIEALIAEQADEESLVAMWEAERVDELLADHQDWLDNLYDLRNRRIRIFDGEDEPEEEGGEEPSVS